MSSPSPNLWTDSGTLRPRPLSAESRQEQPHHVAVLERDLDNVVSAFLEVMFSDNPEDPGMLRLAAAAKRLWARAAERSRAGAHRS